MIRLRARSPGHRDRCPLARLIACLLALAAALPASAGADEVDELVRRMLKAQTAGGSAAESQAGSKAQTATPAAGQGTSTGRNAAVSNIAADPLPERDRRPVSATDMADQCAWSAGDELVLKLGKDCPPHQVAATVRQAVERHAATVNRTNCGPIDQCRERRAFQKLQRYSSLEFERKQVGAPRYYGQK